MNAALLLRFAVCAPFALVELLRSQVVDHTFERRNLAAVGNGCYLPCSTSMRHAENIRLGSRVTIGPHDRLWASENGSIEICDDVLLGPNVTVLTATHAMDDRELPIAHQGAIERDVRIGSGAWIGANAVIMPGVDIGAGAVVGAGSIVTRSVPQCAVVAGVPARTLRTR